MKTTGLFLIGLLIVAALLAGCCGVASGRVAAQPGEEVKAATPRTTDQTSTRNVEDGKIGTTYRIEYAGSEYEATLTQVEFFKSVSRYTQNHSYIMAYFEIKNVGDSNEYFSPDIYAVDETGERYDSTGYVSGGDDAGYSKTLDRIKKLGPGTKTSGWAAIEVPEETKSAKMYFEYADIILSKTPGYIRYSIRAKES